MYHSCFYEKAVSEIPKGDESAKFIPNALELSSYLKGGKASFLHDIAVAY